MKNDVLLKLLEDLPDDLIESAAEPEQSRRPVFLRYAIPAIAACMVIVIAAVIYPKLKTVTPERTEESAFTAAVTTLQPAETLITGNVPAEVQTVTETEPFAVHIVTAPAYPAVTGKRVTAAPGETLPENPPQDTDGNGEPAAPSGTQDNNPQQQNAVTRPAVRTTANVTTRTRTHTTAKTVTTRIRTATEAVPGTQANALQTEAPTAATKEASVQTDPAPASDNPGTGEEAQTPTGPTPGGSQDRRIPCSYIVDSMNGGSDKAGEPTNQPPVGNSAPPAAELKGNRLTVRTERPCTRAFIAYLALRDGHLRIEVYYDRTDPRSTADQEFTVYLPDEYAYRIWDIESVCYEVDNIDDYDYDEEEVTLIVLA